MSQDCRGELSWGQVFLISYIGDELSGDVLSVGELKKCRIFLIKNHKS